MGVGAGVYMYGVVVDKFTFVISSPDEFLWTCFTNKQIERDRQTDRQTGSTYYPRQPVTEAIIFVKNLVKMMIFCPIRQLVKCLWLLVRLYRPIRRPDNATYVRHYRSACI